MPPPVCKEKKYPVYKNSWASWIECWWDAGDDSSACYYRLQAKLGSSELSPEVVYLSRTAPRWRELWRFTTWGCIAFVRITTLHMHVQCCDQWSSLRNVALNKVKTWTCILRSASTKKNACCSKHIDWITLQIYYLIHRNWEYGYKMNV